MKRLIFWGLALSLCCLISCTPAKRHLKQVRGDSSDRVSVGKVQRKIRVGMTNSQVIEVLGSPNIVTTDQRRREVWTYDKVATESAYSETRGGVFALILGRAGSSGANATHQRTLTVIVYYDDDSKVRDFAYHTSSF